MDGSNCGILSKIHVRKIGLVVMHAENEIVSTKTTPLELNSTFDDSFSSRFFIYLISMKRVIVKDTIPLAVFMVNTGIKCE